MQLNYVTGGCYPSMRAYLDGLEWLCYDREELVQAVPVLLSLYICWEARQVSCTGHGKPHPITSCPICRRIFHTYLDCFPFRFPSLELRRMLVLHG